jgi:membrane protein implicated in regulation of membrane protease activity
MDWVTANMAESLIIVGLLLLAIEIAVLGFSTFVLFFVGLAAVLTGGLLYVGLIPDSMLSALLSIGVLTALSATLLWKPLKNMQKDVDTKKASSDLIGHRFVLTEEVSLTANPVYRYSGIDWKLKSNQPLNAQALVEVTDVEVGVFTVKAATQA